MSDEPVRPRRKQTLSRMYSEDMSSDAMAKTRKATVRRNTAGRGLPKLEPMSDEELERRERAAENAAQQQQRGGAKAKMRWEDEAGACDMIKIEELSVEALVENLRQRYDAERYYTYCGSILVALNPYYRLHNKYYTTSITQQYRNKRLGVEPPHVFAIADDAFRTLKTENASVGVVISGESGAGKTETTKLIINYIAANSSKVTETETKLMESASLLEAFGNAKTIRNNNSSRFGKLIKVIFTKDYRIAGARLETYLLEKSRVSLQEENERNYHIFYQLCDGAPKELREKLKLKPSSEFEYTKTCTDIGNDEQAEYEATVEAMTLFGWPQETRDFIFRICAAILHLGELVFEDEEEKGFSDVANYEILEEAAKLMGLPHKVLYRMLTTTTIVAGTRKLKKNLNENECEATRDTLCREIYSRLFDRCVEMINEALAPPEDIAARNNFLGVLDIFGFENFPRNSFEQLLINYANEKLHSQFIDHVFKLEQAEYAEEGISWNDVGADELDRQECLDLIESKMGLFAVLDEECFLQSSSDDKLLRRLEDTFDRKNKYFGRARLRRGQEPSFVVKHFAEPVTYAIDGFRKKNTAQMSQDVVEAIADCEEPLLTALFAKDVAEAAKTQKLGRRSSIRKAGNSISAIFRKQLNDLKRTLDSTIPYFVRCIKPNFKQKPHDFDAELIGKQLAYSGMVETVRIRSLGYPVRFDFARLKRDFGILWKAAGDMPETAGGAKQLLKPLSLPPESWQVGKSKVFMRLPGSEKLAELRDAAIVVYALRVQKWARMFLMRSKYLRKRATALTLQRNIRTFLANQRLRKKVVAALICAREGERRRTAARRLQAAIRVFLHNARLRRLVRASLSVVHALQRGRQQAAQVIERNVVAWRGNERLKRVVCASLAVTRACQAAREKNVRVLQRNVRSFLANQRLKHRVTACLVVVRETERQRREARIAELKGTLQRGVEALLSVKAEAVDKCKVREWGETLKEARTAQKRSVEESAALRAEFSTRVSVVRDAASALQELDPSVPSDDTALHAAEQEVEAALSEREAALKEAIEERKVAELSQRQARIDDWQEQVSDFRSAVQQAQQQFEEAAALPESVAEASAAETALTSAIDVALAPVESNVEELRGEWKDLVEDGIADDVSDSFSAVEELAGEARQAADKARSALQHRKTELQRAARAKEVESAQAEWGKAVASTREKIVQIIASSTQALEVPEDVAALRAWSWDDVTSGLEDELAAALAEAEVEWSALQEQDALDGLKDVSYEALEKELRDTVQKERQEWESRVTAALKRGEQAQRKAQRAAAKSGSALVMRRSPRPSGEKSEEEDDHDSDVLSEEGGSGNARSAGDPAWQVPDLLLLQAELEEELDAAYDAFLKAALQSLKSITSEQLVYNRKVHATLIKTANRIKNETAKLKMRKAIRVLGAIADEAGYSLPLEERSEHNKRAAAAAAAAKRETEEAAPGLIASVARLWFSATPSASSDKIAAKKKKADDSDAAERKAAAIGSNNDQKEPKAPQLTEDDLLDMLDDGLPPMPDNLPDKVAFIKVLANAIMTGQNDRDEDDSDRLYELCYGPFKEVLTEDPRNPDIKINCATLLINWVALRLKLDRIVLKGPTIFPLLNFALRILNEALDSSLLGFKGAKAARIRIKSLEALKKKAVKMDSDSMGRMMAMLERHAQTLKELEELGERQDAKIKELMERVG